jgi:hypothetical protein
MTLTIDLITSHLCQSFVMLFKKNVCSKKQVSQEQYGTGNEDDDTQSDYKTGVGVHCPRGIR